MSATGLRSMEDLPRRSEPDLCLRRAGARRERYHRGVVATRCAAGGGAALGGATIRAMENLTAADRTDAVTLPTLAILAGSGAALLPAPAGPALTRAGR